MDQVARTDHHTMVELSTGAYKAALIPMLENWDQIQHTADTRLRATSDDIDVSVVQVRPDLEQADLVIQVVASLRFNGSNITIHFYHTTQSIMVQVCKMQST